MAQDFHSEDHKKVHIYLATNNTEVGRALYESIFEPLRKFVFTRTKGSGLSEADKEDIVSEALQRSIEKLSIYNGNSSFFTFVCGIAKMVIRERFKMSRKESDTILLDVYRDDDSEEDIPYFGITPEQYVIRKEDQERVRRGLTNLKPEYRDILRLRVINKVPYDAISKLSGESISALESRFRRALIELKKII